MVSTTSPQPGALDGVARIRRLHPRSASAPAGLTRKSREAPAVAKDAGSIAVQCLVFVGGIALLCILGGVANRTWQGGDESWEGLAVLVGTATAGLVTLVALLPRNRTRSPNGSWTRRLRRRSGFVSSAGSGLSRNSDRVLPQPER